MSTPPFLNSNANRAFPFVGGTVDDPSQPTSVIEGLPNGAVVDAGIVAGPASEYQADQHQVWLHEIRRNGSTFELELRSDAPGLQGHPMVFARQVGDSDYAIEDREVAAASALPLSDSASESMLADGCDAEPLWEGYLITGSIGVLEDLLPGDGSIGRATQSGGVFEPALVQNLAGSFVGSINLANDDRTRADAPAGCSPIQWAHPIDITHISSLCLQGSVRLEPGYNALIQQVEADNALRIGASVGAGAGEICDQQPKLFPGEEPPPGSNLLEGGPECNEVIRSINGIGGQALNLLGGAGVSVQADPDNHRVTVNASMERLAVCFDDEDVLATSESVSEFGTAAESDSESA